MLLDPQQLRTLRGWQLTGASLSFLTCVFAVFNILAKLRGGGCLKVARPPPNELRSPLRPFRFLDKLILILFIFDVLEAGTMLLTPAAFEFRQACKAQAFFEVWVETCIIQWNVLLSVYSWMVVRRRAVQRLEANFPAVLLIVLGLGLSLATVLFLQNKLGNAVINCWIRQEHMAEQFLYFFLPLFTAWLIICTIAIRVCVLLQRQLGETSQPHLLQGSLGVLVTRVRRQAMMYSACFIIVWIFPLISRTMLLTGHTPPWPLIVAHSASMTLLGFLDALVYGQVTFNWMGLRAAGVVRILSSSSSAQDRRSSSVSLPSLPQEHKEVMALEEGTHPCSLQSDASTPGHPLHHPHHYQHHLRHPWAASFHTLPIFVTTWNMGACEASSLSDVSSWIPGRSAGYHTIVVGTQECLFLRELRRAIWRHLGGPESYAMYAEEIGSAQLNGHIGLTVWVRADDVMSGCAERVRSAKTELAGGANLIITRAANKGAVAMAIRYHGCTTVGFVCCHLQADKDGRYSRARERERQLSDILSEVALSPEENGFDVHLQVHHLFLLGDLNFRLGLPSVPAAPTNGDVDGEVWTAADVLRRVHDASLGRLENWRERAYRPLLLGTRGAFAMGEEEGADKADREHRFEELLSRDELREAVTEGRALHGFVEAGPIDFPPTYRTRKDCDLGDYDELSDLSWGYGVTTANELRVRRPSYTDRILVHSLPTRALELVPQGYQSCDTMLGSDHHPVSFHANVTVPLEPDDSHSHNLNGQVELVKVRVKLLVLGVHLFDENGARGGSYTGSEGMSMLSGAPSGVEEDESSADTRAPVPALDLDPCQPPSPPPLSAAAAPPCVPSAGPKPPSLSMLRSGVTGNTSNSSLPLLPTGSSSWLPSTQVSVLFPIPVENTSLRLGRSPSSSQRGGKDPCVKSLSFEASLSQGFTLEASTYRRTHALSLRRRVSGAAGEAAVGPKGDKSPKGDVMPLHAVLSLGGVKGRGGQGVVHITARADGEQLVTLTRGGRRVGEVRVWLNCRVRGEKLRAKGDRPPRRSAGSGDGTSKGESRGETGKVEAWRPVSGRRRDVNVTAFRTEADGDQVHFEGGFTDDTSV